MALVCCIIISENNILLIALRRHRLSMSNNLMPLLCVRFVFVHAGITMPMENILKDLTLGNNIIGLFALIMWGLLLPLLLQVVAVNAHIWVAKCSFVTWTLAVPQTNRFILFGWGASCDDPPRFITWRAKTVIVYTHADTNHAVRRYCSFIACLVYYSDDGRDTYSLHGA